MRLIPLSKGHSAMIDDEDFNRVNQFKWCVKDHTSQNNISKYAMRWDCSVNPKKAVWMHHFISGKGKNEIDHIDGNGINNQKSNFRPATFLLNTRNKAMQSRNTSGFKGVTKRPYGWRAQITINGKVKSLGYSKDPKVCAALYDIAATKHFGEFARTNQKLGTLCH